MTANKENLKGHGFDEITAEEQRKIAQKGGQASVKARRKKKLLKEILDDLLERPAGRDQDGNQINSAEYMAITAVKAAMNGDWKAWELVRETAGQNPVQKIEVAQTDPEVVAEVEAMVYGEDES